MKKLKNGDQKLIDKRIEKSIGESQFARRLAIVVLNSNSYLKTRDRKLKGNSRIFVYLIILGLLITTSIIIPFKDVETEISSVGVIKGPIANEKFAPDAFKDLKSLKENYKYLDSMGYKADEMLFDSKPRKHEK